MKKLDYDYTIKVGFQSLDEMEPQLAYRIGCWIGSSKYIDYEISSVGDCFLYYYKGTDVFVPGFIRKNCYIHNVNYDNKRANSILEQMIDFNQSLED